MTTTAKRLPTQLCRNPDGTIHSGFVIWQAAYADHRLATIPVGGDKLPMVMAWQKTGARRSAALAQVFPFAPAVGVLLGAGNGLTDLDIDTTDERVLADALDRHGTTPIIIGTARRRFKALYRNNGEKRLVGHHRPWPDLPIDLLGGGFTIVPPSFNADFEQYHFITGSLDDIDRLPVMRNLEPHLYRTAKAPRRERANKADSPASRLSGMIDGDGRNQALFEAMGPRAREIYAKGGTRDQLFEAAMNENRACAEPLPVEEVTSVVDSVWWRYTVKGENRIGLHGAFMQADEIDAMIDSDQDALLLLSFLRRHNGPAAKFWITNSLHEEKFGWRRARLVAARNRLIELGYLRQVKSAWSKSPALYEWQGYMGAQK